MKVFVTGASGYIGSAVVKELAGAGHEVTGVSRSGERDGDLARLGARPVRGALGSLSALRDVMSEHDALVHLAVDYGLGPPADLEAIEAMLAAAGHAGRAMSVIYTSGVWVVGESRTPASESVPLVRPAQAVAWRPAHEKRVLEAATDRLASAVIRPGIVYGGGRRGLVSPWFEEALRDGAASFVGTGDQRWAFVHVRDLAALYRLVVERRGRGVFHGVDGASPAVRDAAAAASRAAGKGAVRAVPIEEARRKLGPVADALATDQVIVSARAGEVGWAPRHPPFTESALDAFREWRG